MSKLSQVYKSPAIVGKDIMRFLAHLTDDFIMLERAGLRFLVAEDHDVVPVLPHWDDALGGPKDVILYARQVIADCFSTTLSVTYDPKRKPAEPMDISRALDIEAISAFGLRLLAEEDGASETVEKLCVLVGSYDDIAKNLADTIRRSRHAAFAAFDTSRTEQQVALVHLKDDDVNGATLAGLRARGTEGVFVLAGTEVNQGTIWLPDHLSLGGGEKKHAAKVLSGLKALGKVPDDADWVVYWSAADDIYQTSFTLAHEEFAGLEAVAQTFTPLEISVSSVSLNPTDEAREQLKETIASRQFPVGYKVNLEQVPYSERDEGDLEEIRDTISELEAEIDLINSFAAPQMRLLRFSDAQLPALVDGLCKMPPQLQNHAGFTYAAGHAAGREEPAHFFMYDPSQVSLEGLLPQHYWAHQTDDHRPMSYWLDPFGAVSLTENPDDILVFTPIGEKLSPSINAFGGSLSENLGLVLGNLFVEASEILENSESRPCFVFSKSDLGHDYLEVEVLDVNAFAPVQLSLRWINDHMMVRSPRIADRKTLSALADDLYEGQVAEQLQKDMKEKVEDLSDEWGEAQAGIHDQMDGILSEILSEVTLTQERVTKSYDYLRKATEHVSELEAFLQKTAELMEDVNASELEVVDFAETMRAGRFANMVQLMSEFEMRSASIQEAEKSLQAKTETLNDLRKRLRDYR